MKKGFTVAWLIIVLLIIAFVVGFYFLNMYTNPSAGKPCGGFAGERGELACPNGYRCEYPKPIYPDAQGKCIKVQ